MGKLQFTIDAVGQTITLDWSAITPEQLLWVGKSQGYPEKIFDVSNPPLMIPNPVPVVPWVLQKILEELAAAAYTRYLTETPDPRIAQAQQISDFKPTE